MLFEQGIHILCLVFSLEKGYTYDNQEEIDIDQRYIGSKSRQDKGI